MIITGFAAVTPQLWHHLFPSRSAPRKLVREIDRQLGV